MTFDELQKTWQAQQTGLKLSIDPDLLLREIKRNKRNFDSTVLWRDVREVGVAIAVSILFLHLGLKNSLWPFFLLALLCLYIAVFMIVDRIFQKRKRPVLTESLMGWVKSSLAEVDHQIWLLKNVFWWYLLPPNIGFAIFFGYLAWGTTRELVGTVLVIVLLTLFGCFAFCILISMVIYYMNRHVVRKELSPRRAELEQLRNSLVEA
jgi:hypothetical protein